MINKKKIKELVKKRANTFPDDSSIETCWRELSNELSNDVNETIDFLDKCNVEEIYWISEVFDDISSNFKSQNFIDCLGILQKKFPVIDMSEDIELAKRALKKS